MSDWLKKLNEAMAAVHEAKKMDPVNKKALKKDFDDRADKDIDNDGDVDSSDKYLHNRRKTISKATGKGKETETQVDEALSEYSLEEIESYMMSEKFANLDEDIKKSVSNFVNKAKNTVGNTRRKVFGLNKKEKQAVQRARDERDYRLHKSISDLEKKHKGAFPRKPMTKENVDEAAPKMKGDSFKQEREKGRAHDAAMGRTATGRKKPMTSTQRSLASLRKEEVEIDEGSIKGSGTDRKAVLKKAYRDGEQKTRDFYKNKITKAPRTSDKGIKKAFDAGTKAGDGSSTPTGAKRSKSQDSLAGTQHDQSRVTPTSKSFRSTHSTKQYGIATSKPGRGKLPEEVEIDEGAYVGGPKHTFPQYIGGINSKQANAVKKHLTDKGHSFDDHSHVDRNKKADTHYISMKTKQGHAELQKAKAKHKVDDSEQRRKNLAARGIKEAAIQPATHKGYQDPMDKGLSPSAKVERQRTTDAPSDAFDAYKVIPKTFKDMRASLKNRKLRRGDQATGDTAPVKNDGK